MPLFGLPYLRVLKRSFGGYHGPCGSRGLNHGGAAAHHPRDLQTAQAAAEAKERAQPAIDTATAAAHPPAPPAPPKVRAHTEYSKCAKAQAHATSLAIGSPSGYAVGAGALAADHTTHTHTRTHAHAQQQRPVAAAAAAAAMAPPAMSSPVHSTGLPPAAAAAQADDAVAMLQRAHTHTTLVAAQQFRAAAAAAASAHELQQQQQQQQLPMPMPWASPAVPFATTATATRSVAAASPLDVQTAMVAAGVTAAGPLAGLLSMSSTALRIKYVPYITAAAAAAAAVGQSTGSSAGRPGARGLSVASQALGSRAFASFYAPAASASSNAQAITTGAQSSSQQQHSYASSASAFASASGAGAGRTGPGGAAGPGTSPHGRAAARPFGPAAVGIAGFATAAGAAFAAMAMPAPMETDTLSVGSRSSGGGSPPHSPSSVSASSQSDTDSASSSPRLTASGAAIARLVNPTNAGAAMIPHPAKASKGGEDAVFVSSNGRMPMVLAVADGVGGWGDLGVDPGLFSRALLAGVEHKLNTVFAQTAQHASAIAAAGAAAAASAAGAAGDPAVVSAEQLTALPLELMQFGYDHVRATKLPGSCTACVVAIHNGQLRARNLGDSGFLVLRPSTSAPVAVSGSQGPAFSAGGGGSSVDPLRVEMRSEEQQHSFNFPMQLGCAEGKAEEPWQADAYALQVKAGDVIVVGTDGLFDNLSDATIAAHVTRYLATLAVPSPGGAPVPAASLTPLADTKEVAKLLALEAHRVAGSKERTPFADSARRHGHHYVGGKMDDISVVVGVV